MDRRIVKYLPWITVIVLMVVSGAVIYARGGFDSEKIAGAATTAPTNSPTPSLTPTGAPVRAPAIAPLLTTPLPLGTIPSVSRVGGGEDD